MIDPKFKNSRFKPQDEVMLNKKGINARLKFIDSDEYILFMASNGRYVIEDIGWAKSETGKDLYTLVLYLVNEEGEKIYGSQGFGEEYFDLAPPLPTEDELEAIPEKNFMYWLYSEYGHECGGISWFSIGNDAENGFLQFKTFCSGLNQTYCDVTPEQYEKIKVGYYNDKLHIHKIRADHRSLPEVYHDKNQTIHFQIRDNSEWLEGTWDMDESEFVAKYGRNDRYKPVKDVIEWRYDKMFKYEEDE